MSTKPKHTPGEWSFDLKDSDHELIVSGDKLIAEVIAGACTEEEFNANCYLIRTAPEMLHALMYQEMADADPEAARRKGYYDRARELRKAAIAKATGGAS